VDILGLIKERAGDYDCPVCKRSLDGCSLTLVRDEDPLYTVQVCCAKCQVTFVVVLQVRETSGSTGVVARPRQRRPRAPRKPVAPPIEVDELLDLHELLRDHDGPITDLLRSTAPAQRSRSSRD
jgi:hypothetical protein